jgi:hypothetical protein
MKGIRPFVREFTASAVKEHLRSQIEDTEGVQPSPRTRSSWFGSSGRNRSTGARPRPGVPPPDEEAAAEIRRLGTGSLEDLFQGGEVVIHALLDQPAGELR